MSIHEQERNSSLTTTVTSEKMTRVLLRAKEESQKSRGRQRESSRSAESSGKGRQKSKSQI